MSDPKLPPQGEDAPLELDLGAFPAPARKAPAPPAPRPGKTSEPGARGQKSDFKPTVSSPGLRLPAQAPSGPLSNPVVKPVSVESRSPVASRPFRGSGQAVARALAVAARWLVALSRFGFSKAREHGGKALTDFNGRPEHTRWRSYAFGVYGALVLTTFAVQAWEPNSLAAYIRVLPVAMPESRIIFVRNDSKKTWKDVKVTLNGLYLYERNDLTPGSQFQLPVNRFSVADSSGKVTYAPKELVLKMLTIDCDGGRFEQELDK